MKNWVIICITISLLSCIVSASSSICPRKSNPFVKDVYGSQCPLYVPIISPRQVEGDVVERALSFKGVNVFTSVLFYAAYCPFSSPARLNFEVLSSIYPQVEHLVVEHSSALPSSPHSLFSRYGIHSLPAFFVSNGTSSWRYYGSKDLDSLMLFYKTITGYEPVPDITCDKKESCSFIVGNVSDSLETRKMFIMQSWLGLSVRELLKREPYLAFAVVFLCLSLVVNISPKVLHHLRGIWASYGPDLNMQIFGGTSQMTGRVLQMIDVKRVWTKLRRWKIRNLHRGARNARVWASSFTSVSLGKTASNR
ncbi:reductase [Lithospermum erythrorhizon]|uniref:Reductase n=1 Tax=Lithospermum erythrorhizon TaxID=34254 RepID=A0AAV3NJ83_LITER